MTQSTPTSRAQDALYSSQHNVAVLDRLVHSLSNCTLIINEQLNIAHKFDDTRYDLASQEQLSSYSLKDFLPSDLASSLATAVHQALKTGESRQINAFYANKTQHDALLTIQIKPLVLEAVSPTLVAVMIKDPAARVKLPTASQGAYQNLANYLQTVEQTLDTFQSNTLAKITELEQANQDLQFHNRQLLHSNQELQRINQNMQSINTQLMTTLTTARDLLIELGWDGKLSV